MRKIFILIGLLSSISVTLLSQFEQQGLSGVTPDTAKANILLTRCEQQQIADSLLKYAYEALSLIDSIKHKKQYATILTHLSYGSHKKSDCKASVRYAQRARTINLALKNFAGVGQNIARIAICLRQNGQYREAMEKNRASISFFSKSHDTQSLCIPYLGLGNIYSSLSIIDSAAHYYNLSFQYAKPAIEHQRIAAMALSNLGRLYSSLGKDYQQALNYHRQGLTFAQKSEDLKAQITAYNILGSTFIKVTELDSATIAFQKAIALNQDINKHSLFYSFNNLGVIAKQKNDYELAISYYRKSISCCPNHRTQYLAYGNLGNLHLLQGHVDSAQIYLLRAEKEIEKVKNVQYKRELYSSLATLYKTLKLPNKAYDYLQKSLVVSDSIYNQQLSHQLDRVKIRQRHDSLSLANEKIRAQDIRLKNQALTSKLERLIRIIITLLAAIFLFIGGIYYYRWRQEKLLSQQKDQKIQELFEQLSTRPISLDQPSQEKLNVRFLNSDEKTTALFRDIFYIKSQGNDALVYTIKNEKFWYRGGLKKLAQLEALKTQNSSFFRVHRSYIINLAMAIDYRTRLKGKKRKEIILDEGKLQGENNQIEIAIPIGDAYKDEFIKVFELLHPKKE